MATRSACKKANGESIQTHLDSEHRSRTQVSRGYTHIRTDLDSRQKKGKSRVTRSVLNTQINRGGTQTGFQRRPEKHPIIQPCLSPPFPTGPHHVINHSQRETRLIRHRITRRSYGAHKYFLSRSSLFLSVLHPLVCPAHSRGVDLYTLYIRWFARLYCHRAHPTIEPFECRRYRRTAHDSTTLFGNIESLMMTNRYTHYSKNIIVIATHRCRS